MSSDLQRLSNALRAYVGSTWERIQSLERQIAWDELKQSTSGPQLETQPAAQPAAEPLDPKIQARRILGVADGASFEECRKAFLKLSDRSRPDRFDAGTVESDQAEHIQRRIQWAYNILTEDVPASEKRFRTLEVD